MYILFKGGKTFFLAGQSRFPTFVFGLECRRRDVTSGGNLFTYQVHVSLKQYYVLFSCFGKCC